MIKVFADGCSLGNPGVSGIGVVVYKDENIIKKISKYIGYTTNNVAEYTGLIFALQEIVSSGKDSGQIYLDSELVVKQIAGLYKVRNKNLYPFYVIAKNIMAKITDCKVAYKPREENTIADGLAKGAARMGK